MGEGVNPSKMKLFDVVAHLKTGPTEFGNAFDQS
jgi:hypothetical protein